MAMTITILIVTSICLSYAPWTFTVWIITVFAGAGHDLELLNAIATACLRFFTLLLELDLSFLVFITFAILLLDIFYPDMKERWGAGAGITPIT